MEERVFPYISYLTQLDLDTFARKMTQTAAQDLPDHSVSGAKGNPTGGMPRQDAICIPASTPSASIVDARSPSKADADEFRNPVPVQVSVNHTINELLDMRQYSRIIQGAQHTELALAQLCLGSSIPQSDPPAQPAHPEIPPYGLLLRQEGDPGLNLPLPIVNDRNAESSTPYDPAAAATRYSVVLEEGAYQPEVGLWAQTLRTGHGAYDWNSLAVDSGIDAGAVVRAGLRWKFHMSAESARVVKEIEAVQASKMLSGSVVPRYGIGKTIITGVSVHHPTKCACLAKKMVR